MSQQLVKKGANGRMVNVNPKSWIEAIKDKNTGQTLVEILQGFNMYFLPYNGNTSATRCLVPTMLRKKGLWITYVKYDGNVYTEWYAADELDDKSWGDSSNWRIGNNTLVGDITISANGNWVINGTETEFKAVGEKGNTPLLRVANNRLQVSYNLGASYIDVTTNPVYTKFRWLATTGDTQANNVGRIQASTDEGKTWTNMSNDFTNNLHIKKYIGVNESLPTSGIAEGTIYAKGPYYAEDDTLNNNPIYRLWVYAWKGNTLAWQDNGEFQSIAAGVVQETGDSETKVMSQKAVTEKLSELGSKVEHVIVSTTNADEQILKKIMDNSFKTEFVERETAADNDDDEITITTNDDEIIARLRKDGSDFKSLKSDGDRVVTEKEIKNLVSKDVLTDELSKKQDTIKNVSSEFRDKDVEEMAFCSEDEKEVFALIGEYGIKAKAFRDLKGTNIASLINEYTEVYGVTTMGKYVSNNGENENNSENHKITTFDVSQLTGNVLVTTYLLNEVKYTCFGYANGTLIFKGQLVPQYDYKLGEHQDIIDVTNVDTIKVNARSDGESHLYIQTLKSQSDVVSQLFNVENASIAYKEIGLFLGDSIMQGVGSYYNANAVRYAEQLLGADCYNLGIGGGRMAYSESRRNDLHNVLDAILDNNWDKVDSVVNSTSEVQSTISRLEEYNRVKDLLESKGLASVDFIAIAYGFNDWNGGVTIDNNENAIDKTTIIGSLRFAIQRIREKIPKVRIYVMCPGMAFFNGESTDTSTNSINKHLWEISDAIEEACKKNHIPCFNQYWSNNVDNYNYSVYLSDGVHRSVTGYKLLGKQYAKFILNN